MYNFDKVRADSISVFNFDRFWSPRVFSAYYTPLSKSRQFPTHITACHREHGFLCLTVLGFPSEFTIGSFLNNTIFLSEYCCIVNVIVDFEKYLIKKLNLELLT